MNKWEYHVEMLQLGHQGGRELGSEIDHLGEQGWELVSVIPVKSDHCMCFFKRSK